MIAIYLKDIPEDIAKIILKAQGEIKEKKCMGKYSQSLTVIHLLREGEFAKKELTKLSMPPTNQRY
ncbi:MAG: hypothetical protein ABIP51_22690 [Bacteroidia bacterium]